jgi:TRAP-type C4-dicarboxylate transport system permease small subunit
MLYLLGILVCAIAVGCFAVWAIRKFVPAEMQKWVFLLVGLVALVFFCYFVMTLVGSGGSFAPLRIR